MRISDWSSDVCSSDLSNSRRIRPCGRPSRGARRRAAGSPFRSEFLHLRAYRTPVVDTARRGPVPPCAMPPLSREPESFPPCALIWGLAWSYPFGGSGRNGRNAFQSVRSSLRSEEHTSELQSLMRISYAVFCLNKKTHTSHH